ncbi:hypothetical protein F4X88_14940 [Candidatus Poribacteria bacterium]|nr:hypothetical protein [Candidatus Poribacteria bacterium]
MNVGIKRLSQVNIVLAFILLLTVICLGPTLYIFNPSCQLVMSCKSMGYPL